MKMQSPEGGTSGLSANSIAVHQQHDFCLSPQSTSRPAPRSGVMTLLGVLVQPDDCGEQAAAPLAQSLVSA
jgi:hypothetical protein